ncbi:alpha/beta hydrolase [Secundilactobacillus folii]|uniref:Alpha/beta hydrolase n=1 Tax=Secundilactobacillus folii TaxID=2678357 RepID=A0A7X2XU41_9LACO|nr:alpha/beta hydrolase [Secundilactobacillus folii]MTV81713.1 alpha/beta hydrolase [Secundilactobacillus folii]
MRKRHIQLLVGIVMLAAVFLMGFGVHQLNVKSSDDKAVAMKTMSSSSSTQIHSTNQKQNIPTIFIHGVGGKLISERPMVAEAVKAKKASWGLTVYVRANGQINIHGTLKNKNNPIILVQFNNNVAGEEQDAKWLKAVLAELKTKYEVENYNLVGHSMGAYAAVYYAEYFSQAGNQPQMNKLITIAGPFDGILARRRYHWEHRVPRWELKLWDDSENLNHVGTNGKPAIIHPEYRTLLQKRNQFPQQVAVLNLFGNVGSGHNSDGTVSTASARSLRYLVTGRAKSYQEEEITGQNASHFALHQDNKAVRQWILRFLWQDKTP